MPRATLPDPQPNWALFLDFDGCIVEIAPTPQSVEIPATLLALLDDLRGAFGNAVAIVTGRSIAQIDDFLDAAVPAVAGLHGFERRSTDGAVLRPPAPASGVQKARALLEDFAAAHQGIFVEDKKYAVALHYRLKPELADECRDAVIRATAGLTDDWDFIEGKCIFDIKPRSHTKGSAIQAFLKESPFLGRVPVFCGDDVTDEDGFTVVNARNGVSIRVGNGTNTKAKLQVGSVDELLDWLTHVARAIGKKQSVKKEPT